MYAFVLAVCASCVLAPAELEPDVYEWDEQAFALPVKLSAAERAATKQIRLLASADRGRTWRHLGNYEADLEKLEFFLPVDGMYWFGVQIEFKDDTVSPADIKDMPVMKVFVNTIGRRVVVKKSSGKPQDEKGPLRKVIAELERKLGVSELKAK